MANSPRIKFCPLALRRLCRRTGWFIAAAAGFTVLTAHWHSATAAPGRSTTIALTSDERRVAVVNREANSLSIIRVKKANGKMSATRLPKSALAKSRVAWL